MAQLHVLTCIGNICSTVQHFNQWVNYIPYVIRVVIVTILHQHFQQTQDLQNIANIQVQLQIKH